MVLGKGSDGASQETPLLTRSQALAVETNNSQMVGLIILEVAFTLFALQLDVVNQSTLTEY